MAIPLIENGDLMLDVRTLKLNPLITNFNKLETDVATLQANHASLEQIVAAYLDFFVMTQQEINNLSVREAEISADKANILNYIFDSIYPRIYAIEKIVGITGGDEVELPGSKRPDVTWEHEAWMADSTSAYFQTNDIDFGAFGTLYDIASTGLTENSNVLNGGVGWTQLNWGHARTTIRVLKSSIEGWNDNVTPALKALLFSNWFITHVKWLG